MIVTELMGGLGNQMFQYALGRALAEKHGTELFLDTNLLGRLPRENYTRDYDLGIFNIQENFASENISIQYGTRERSFKERMLRKIRRFFPGGLVPIYERYFHFDPSVLNYSDNLYLHGYWQTEKYFKHIEHIIRQDFTFKEPLNSRAISIAENIKSSNSVCMHIRRGDYVIASGFYDTYKSDYYTQAENILVQRIKEPLKVFVFSDDIEWCRENIKPNAETYYVSGKEPGLTFRDDFELMTLCKHFIIANSSFSWWAAYLGNNPDKVVIAPKRWFTDETVDTSDLIPDGWIRI